MDQSVHLHGHPYGSYSAPSIKRSRPDDFDLSVVDQSGLDGVQTSPIYAQAAAAAAAASSDQPPMHHHHHLPDLGPPSKSMRREDAGGAPSMVGQVGMPSPAARPRGPKLKFTAEDDQLLIELKEQKNLTWKQIADFFPGRSSGTLQVRYCTKLKAKTTLWTEDMDQKLRKALQDYENEKWRIVAHKVGSGFTPAACRERSGQLAGEEPEHLWQSLSPKAASLPESMEMTHSQRPW
ncbi:MYB DNA-binding domain-containing protein [Ophiocordyceps sinensis CO18]|nr:MYB DNA-binding domain-containing protein [Ophiocordyceps sinensis CO18]